MAKGATSKGPTSAERQGGQARELRARIEASPAGKVKVAVTDVDGILRGKYLHKDKLSAALDRAPGFSNVVFCWSPAAARDRRAVGAWV